MRLLVIGTIINDRIYHRDGSISYSLGGLLYTLLPFRALLDKGDRVIPLCRVGRDIYNAVVDWLTADRICDTVALLKTEQKNNTVELRYLSEQEREERSFYPLPSLRFHEVKPFLDVDAVFVNMISGWELDLDVLRHIRKAFKGLIFLDIHSLALERKSDGRRIYRNISDGIEWLRNADVIQLNRNEWQVLAGDMVPELFIKECCFNQHKIINLLLSSEGSKTYLWDKGSIRSFATAPYREIEVVDPTGCGDAYLAGFGVEYLRSANATKAAETANLCATLMGSFKGLPDSRQYVLKYRMYNKEVEWKKL